MPKIRGQGGHANKGRGLTLFARCASTRCAAKREQDEKLTQISKYDPGPANTSSPRSHAATGTGATRGDGQPELCAAWNCSCQTFSDIFNAQARISNFRDKPDAQQWQWWRDQSCDTKPMPAHSAQATFLIHADDSEIERGLFHRSLNKMSS